MPFPFTSGQTTADISEFTLGRFTVTTEESQKSEEASLGLWLLVLKGSSPGSILGKMWRFAMSTHVWNGPRLQSFLLVAYFIVFCFRKGLM